MTVDGGESEGLIWRKDLVISKALTVDLAFSDAGGRKDFLVRAINKINDNRVEGFEIVLAAELVDVMDGRGGLLGSNDGV